MAAQPFILTIDGVRPFCYSDYNFGWNESKRRRLDEVNPKENDNEIIELTDEELDEIFERTYGPIRRERRRMGL